MDELQRSIYVDRFRLAFREHRGTAFQDWFVRLAGHAFGTDFEEVRPYAYLKSLSLPADTIFRHLQDYAGMQGEPKRQGAALAVLAYFFDSCDIFEDPAPDHGHP